MQNFGRESMDPFNEVKDDAWSAISVLDSIVSERLDGKSRDLLALAVDFDNNMLELEEIMVELRQAVEVGEANPENFQLTRQDIATRSAALDELHSRINGVARRWHEAQSDKGINVRQVTTMSNRISQDDGIVGGLKGEDAKPSLSQFQEQQYIQEQDNQLDNIHITMRNLNAQAAAMGNELEEQGHYLDELDYEVDTVGGKLRRGMRRIETVLDQNRDNALNCCIMVLVVVLGVLLVVIIAV